jgi:hypothetical protein
MLFRAYGQAPIPLEGQELAERLEALRRRNRGAEQRRREQARDAHRRVMQPSGSQVQPPTDVPVFASAVYRAPTPEPDVYSNSFLLDDEDWGAAVVDFDLLMEMDGDALEPVICSQPAPPVEQWHTDWMVVPWVPPPPPEVELLPGGIPVVEFSAFVAARCHSSLNTLIDQVMNNWSLASDERPKILLAVQLIRASRQDLAFTIIEQLSQSLSSDPSGTQFMAWLIEFASQVAICRL